MPGPAQGDPDVAVAERDRDLELVGDLGGLEQLAARGDAELHAQALLVGGEDQVDQQRGELLVANHLPQVLGLEAPLLGQRLVALAVELDTDAIGLLALDDLAHQVDGLLGDVGGADQDELAPTHLEDAHVARVVPGAAPPPLSPALRSIRPPAKRDSVA